MTYERLGSRSVTAEVEFKHPFTLGGDVRELPAGVYTIYTHQDVHHGALDPIYVSINVELVVVDGSRNVSHFVDPEAMRLALAQDENRTSFDTGASASPARIAT